MIGVLGATLVLAAALAAVAAPETKALGLTAGVNVNLGAEVNLGLNLTGLSGLNPSSASSLDDALSRSPASLVQALACPAVSTVAGATEPIPGVGALTDQLASVACALNILGYAYRTTYVPPSGPKVVRYTRAVAAVPTPLDVNGDGIVDFKGTASANLTLNGVNLSISRLAFPADAKVSIEAVMIDPLTPKTYLGFGEDGTKAGTASNWQATVSVFGISSTTTDLGLNISTSGAPSKLSTLGEVFSGPSADAPSHISRGNLSFTPVPASLTTRVLLSQGRQQAIVTSTAATKVGADVDLITPEREKNIDATVDKLPTSVDIVHQSRNGEETVTYTAGSTISRLSAAYHDRAGSSIQTAAQLDATNVPARITFQQVDGRTTVDSPGGSFGSVEARFAKGGDVPASGAASGPYAAFHRFNGSKLTAGLRLTNLKSVTIDPSGPYSGRLVFSSPLPALPLSAEDDMSGVTLTGRLSNLPLDTLVTADLDNGIVTFDGHGQGIDEIALHARKANGPFFARATRLDATIEGIPAQETIKFEQADGAVTVAATNPIGKITLLASDGSDAPAVDGSYAWYEDTPSRYRAFVRISGLTGLSFAGDPVAGAIDTSTAQVLNLHAETGGVTFDSVIDKLPPHVGFTLTPGAGGSQVVDYNTNGTEIGKITVDATGLQLPNGADKLHAEIDNLPSHMTLTLPASGGAIAFDPHGDHIGRVLAQAYGDAGPANAADGRQLLHYNEAKAQITIDVRNVGALSATQSTSPLNLSYDISSAPLDFGVELSDGTYFNGTISNPQPATIFVDPSDGATAVLYQVQQGGPNFRGNGQIDQIDIYTNAAGGYLEGHLSNVPARLYACVQGKTGTRCKPTWVPLTTVADGDTYSVPHPSFAFQLLPTDLNNEVPANRLTLNGILCPDQEDPALCNDASKKNARILIDDLMFNTVEAAVGHRDDGCAVIPCGRVWAGFNTKDDHINGRVRYIEQGADDTLVDFRAPNPDSFLAANRKFYFLRYGASGFDDASSGSISCGSPRPNLEIEASGFNPDLLTGDNIPGDGLCG